MSAGNEPTSESSTRAITVFQWVETHHEYLIGTFDKLLNEPGSTLSSRCMYLAHQIQKACAKQPVGLLAALQLNRAHPYHYIKELFAAVLSELVAKELGVPTANRLYLCCAAMTQDIGMLELQDEALDHQNAPLTAAQQKLVDKHLQNGKAILQRCGVTEPLWLLPLYQHHERPDGQGYPQGLRAGEISLGAHILHVVDAYVAMIRPRGDRPALLPRDALKHLFQQRDKQFDTSAVRALAKVLGSYPPGVWVQLANGEVGIVSERAENGPFPQVSVVLSADQEHLETAILRDTAEGRFTIVESVPPPFHFSLGTLLSSMWPPIN